jgi:hypothetical protein
MLYAKLYPFLEMNEGSVRDYIDLQRLMCTLNAHYRNESFRVFGDTRVASAFRDNVCNGFQHFIARHRYPQTEQSSSAPISLAVAGSKAVSTGADPV